MKKIEWKKYLAWVFFLLGAISVGNMIIRYGTDNPHKLLSLNVAAQNPSLENILGALFTIFWIALMAFFFRLWYKWR